MKALFLVFLSVGIICAQPQLERFDVDGHQAFLQAAAEPAPEKPWIWYAPNVNGNFILLKHRIYTDAFLNAGIAIASCDLGEVRGAPGSTAKFSQFYKEMVHRGYSAKPILLGQSRGGMMTLAWAVRNPDKVTAWVGIYPVCNLTSYPLSRSSIAATLADFGMDEQGIRARLDAFNPISNLEGLAKNKVPMFSVHGDKDAIVPHEENTMLLQRNYESLGGPIEVKVVPGGGHEISPAFFECQELLDFIIKHAASARSMELR
ncbi:MAG: alpha/beta hydrolase family protein [Luteolibacter sp.]